MSLWTLFIADMHVGSPFSIWPENCLTSNGVAVNLNEGQEYILHNFKWATERVVELCNGELNLLVLVGDIVHGKQKKDDGVNLIEPDPQYQARAAIELLEPIAGMSKEVHMVQGTKYHVGVNAEAEEWIGYSLGACMDSRNHYCTEWIPYLGIEGVGFDIAHHRSVTMINRSMPLERERRFANQISDLKYGPIHLIVRGHAHIYVYLDIDGERELGLPAMALQDAYCKKSRTPNRLLSRWLGFVLVEIVPENLGTGMSPVIPHPIMFPHPPLPHRLYGEFSNGDEEAGVHDGGYLARISQRIRDIASKI